MVRAQEHITHAYLQGVVVIDRSGMESRVFVFDKYSSGRCVELDIMGNTQETSNAMMDCMRPTYVHYNNISKIEHIGGGSRGGGVRVARQFGNENVWEFATNKGIHFALHHLYGLNSCNAKLLMQLILCFLCTDATTIDDHVAPYCCNSATQNKFGYGTEKMEHVYEEITSANTPFYNTIHKCFEASFGSAYTSAIEPHAEAYRAIDEERTQSRRNVLRYTPYIHANVSFSTHKDGPTQICTHVDDHTKKNSNGLVPVVWLPCGRAPPNTMFGFPTLGNFGLYLDITTPTFTLMNDMIPHGSSSFDATCDECSAVHGIELGVAKKIFCTKQNATTFMSSNTFQ